MRRGGRRMLGLNEATKMPQAPLSPMTVRQPISTSLHDTWNVSNAPLTLPAPSQLEVKYERGSLRSR